MKTYKRYYGFVNDERAYIAVEVQDELDTSIPTLINEHSFFQLRCVMFPSKLATIHFGSLCERCLQKLSTAQHTHAGTTCLIESI